MQHLHAYWRMEYIEAPKGPSSPNPFKELPSQDDRTALIVYRSEQTFLVLNRYPYNPGHLLLLPYREVSELADLSAAERADFMSTLILGQDILSRALQPSGFNVGINLGASAGAGIPRHLHAHLVPRWNGDTNFMPVIGDTRVLPQSLDAMWNRLREFCPPATKA